MSYYQGDYYQGDYYQGDPFLGAILGTVVPWLGKKLLGRGASKAAIATAGGGAAVGGGTGLVTGAIGGELLQRGGAALWQKIRGGRPETPRPFQPPGMPPRMQSTVSGTLVGAGGGVCCPPGYHPNKSMTKMGHPPGSTCVRNRSMNVANPRALRRSLRRVAGFGKLASRARKTVNATARAMK